MTETLVDSLVGRQLSWAVATEYNPDLTVAEYDPRPHPQVSVLARDHGMAGLQAVHVWRSQVDMGHKVSAVIRWMTAGAFKGKFATEAAFCRAHFSTGPSGRSLMDHLTKWDGVKVGFSRWPELSPGVMGGLFDWEEWARQTLNRPGSVFRALHRESGVYVFDVTKSPYDYDEQEQELCPTTVTT